MNEENLLTVCTSVLKGPTNKQLKDLIQEYCKPGLSDKTFFKNLLFLLKLNTYDLTTDH